MNDFTKEELQDLLSTIGAVRVYTDTPCWDEELFNKIQSMIDNYCDHSGHIGVHDWKTCNDCGQPFVEHEE